MESDDNLSIDTDLHWHFQGLADSIFSQSNIAQDVQIHCAGGDVLKANRHLLSLGSHLFREIFGSFCACVTIMPITYDVICPDFCSDTLNRVLKSIRTGRMMTDFLTLAEIEEVQSIVDTLKMIVPFEVEWNATDVTDAATIESNSDGHCALSSDSDNSTNGDDTTKEVDDNCYTLKKTNDNNINHQYNISNKMSDSDNGLETSSSDSFGSANNDDTTNEYDAHWRERYMYNFDDYPSSISDTGNKLGHNRNEDANTRHNHQWFSDDEHPDSCGGSNHLKLNKCVKVDLQLNKCFSCDKSFDDSQQFLAHVNVVHSHRKMFKEKRSGSKFKLNYQVYKHIVIGDDLLEECGQCQKTFKTPSEFRRHSLLAHGQRKPTFKCQLCGKRFTSLSNRNFHVRNIHNVRHHIC